MNYSMSEDFIALKKLKLSVLLTWRLPVWILQETWEFLLNFFTLKVRQCFIIFVVGFQIQTSGDDMEHICRLIDYAVAMRQRLQDVNVHSFNNFDLRVGISWGPLVGGVIGARKPVFDIWGNTVNEASRMDSTGEMGKIQVPTEIAKVKFSINFLTWPNLENFYLTLIQAASTTTNSFEIVFLSVWQFEAK